MAIKFEGIDEADQVLNELRRLQKEYLVDLEDAVVVVRGPDSKVQLNQSIPLELFVALPARSQGAAGKVLAELSRFRGKVLRTSLSPEQEHRLQAAISKA